MADHSWPTPYLRSVSRDYPTALRIGALLGETGTDDVVVVDAAVMCAHGNSSRHPRYVRLPRTSDPGSLRKPDPTVPLIVVQAPE